MDSSPATDKNEIQCFHCGKTISNGFLFCPYCGAAVQISNTSGQGINAVVPPSIQGWNWGSFFLTFIWGVFNNVWLSLLYLVPPGNVIMPFVLGIKGNEWAWQYKQWDSIEHFQRVQRTWMLWGIVAFIAPFVLIIGISLIIIGILGYFGYITGK